MKFSVINLGCKVNAYECESVAAALEQAGYERTESNEDCEICVVFTCAVTNAAAAKSRQIVHRMRRHHPNAVLAVAGCYVQVDPEALSDVDILVGTANKGKIESYITAFLKDRKPVRDIPEAEVLPFDNLELNHFETQTRAYLKIQDGCNQFCAYCVIPYARGRERSMEPNAVIKACRKLSEHHREIVLTGIHTGRYGREYGISLAQLMKRILSEVPALERLRISSIEITEVDDELIELMRSDRRVAKHLHIPLQSGCDTVLERMNRPYKTNDYYAKILKIRELIPDISISTDLIVGFPQESESEFEETVSFLKKCEFSFLHVFPFSLREGTKAASMSGQLSASVKKQRVKQCTELSSQLYDCYMERWIGKSVEVLFEKPHDDYSSGHTSQYLPIRIEGCRIERGTIEPVRIVKLYDHQLIGERQ